MRLKGKKSNNREQRQSMPCRSIARPEARKAMDLESHAALASFFGCLLGRKPRQAFVKANAG
jgi:hypothetical protein